MSISYRTSLAFTRLKDADLLTVGDGVVAGLSDWSDPVSHMSL
jgi:hypothetical protein